MTARPSVLVSDLDGTLLGDDLALASWRDWYERSRPAWRLVYATGRSFASVDGLVRSGILPAPAAIIADVGTSIHDLDGRRWPAWPTAADDWSASLVLDVGRASGLRPQEPAAQTPWKVSFEVQDMSPLVVDGLRLGLRDAGINAEIVTSAGRLIDVLPSGIGKGAACRYLVHSWSIPLGRVIAAGDSGNDLDLLGSGVRAIVVANADPDLDGLRGPRIYRAAATHAAGVLEGIRHWRGAATTRATAEAALG